MTNRGADFGAMLALGMWLGGRQCLGATPDGFRRLTLGLLAFLPPVGIVRVSG